MQSAQPIGMVQRAHACAGLPRKNANAATKTMPRRDRDRDGADDGPRGLGALRIVESVGPRDPEVDDHQHRRDEQERVEVEGGQVAAEAQQERGDEAAKDEHGVEDDRQHDEAAA